jgi:RNA polymerase sigma-70 factor (ECF subfamily)
MHHAPMPPAWRRLLEFLEPVHDETRRLARRLSRSNAEGDDLFQDAVLRAYEKLDGLRDPGRFRAWFMTVLISVHRSRARRSFWRRFLSLEQWTGAGREPEAPVASSAASRADGARRLAHALAQLPAAQREAIVLFEIEELSVEEIAAAQAASVSAVKSRLARGRERLRRHYARLGFSADGGVPVRRKRRARPGERTGTRSRGCWQPALRWSLSVDHAQKEEGHEPS